MNEQIFFNIGGKDLLLDKVLVEFNEMPIFFVCKYEKNYFVSSCLDMENEEYLVAQVELKDLSEMLHGKITMRDLILKGNRFWNVIVGEDIASDMVKEQTLDSIQLDELPYEGAYLNLATKDLIDYSETIDGILLRNDFVLPMCVNVNIIMEQLEMKLQAIYESSNSIFDEQFDFSHDGENMFVEEISNTQLSISVKNMRNETEIKESDQRLFAA